jgi:hypothetical protein
LILGDDATIVDGEIRPTPLYEKQIQDQRIHRTLGLTTTKYMHPVGLNITIDDAPKVRHVIMDEWVKNRLQPEERRMVAELFTGFINGVPLWEVMEKAEPEPFWYSPKQYIAKALKMNLAEYDGGRLSELLTRPNLSQQGAEALS